MLSKLMLSHWWVLLLRGVLAILFGIAAYAWPGMTLVTLLTLFGAFALVDGSSMCSTRSAGARRTNTGGCCCSKGCLASASASSPSRRPSSPQRS